MAFKGGEVPTNLGKGQDGFNVTSHQTTYSQPSPLTVEVGRDESVNEQADNRKGVA